MNELEIAADERALAFKFQRGAEVWVIFSEKDEDEPTQFYGVVEGHTRLLDKLMVQVICGFDDARWLATVPPSWVVNMYGTEEPAHD